MASGSAGVSICYAIIGPHGMEKTREERRTLKSPICPEMGLQQSMKKPGEHQVEERGEPGINPLK